MNPCLCVLCTSIVACTADLLVKNCENLYHYYKNHACDKSRSFQIWVDLWVYGQKVQGLALIDSGATLSVINSDFVDKHRLVTHDKKDPFWIHNADGSYNKNGLINKSVKGFMQHGEHKEKVFLTIMKIHNHDLILGYDWLIKHNPTMDWNSGSLVYRCGSACPEASESSPDSEEVAPDDEEDNNNISNIWDSALDTIGDGNPDDPFIKWIGTLSNEELGLLMGMVGEIHQNRPEAATEKWKQLVPKEYWEFGPMVFSQKASERMPTRKPYDHAINLIEGTPLPTLAKPYSLLPKEENSLRDWIAEEKRKGYI